MWNNLIFCKNDSIDIFNEFFEQDAKFDKTPIGIENFKKKSYFEKSLIQDTSKIFWFIGFIYLLLVFFKAKKAVNKEVYEQFPFQNQERKEQIIRGILYRLNAIFVLSLLLLGIIFSYFFAEDWKVLYLLFMIKDEIKKQHDLNNGISLLNDKASELIKDFDKKNYSSPWKMMTQLFCFLVLVRLFSLVILNWYIKRKSAIEQKLQKEFLARKCFNNNPESLDSQDEIKQEVNNSASEPDQDQDQDSFVQFKNCFIPATNALLIEFVVLAVIVLLVLLLIKIFIIDSLGIEELKTILQDSEDSKARKISKEKQEKEAAEAKVEYELRKEVASDQHEDIVF